MGIRQIEKKGGKENGTRGGVQFNARKLWDRRQGRQGRLITLFYKWYGPTRDYVRSRN